MKKKELYFPITDPRNINYPRVLDYPNISLKHTLSNFFFSLIPIVLLIIVPVLFCPISVATVIAVLFTIVYFFVMGKRILIGAVQLYQWIAPTKLRKKCRFEPSCSQYMIMAIEKYGAIKGLIKGMRRLKKCNNRGNGLRGGFDYP